jgi:polar amino acid transport system substrate-binding protein
MKLKLVIGLWMALIFAGGSVPAQEMMVLTEESPPFNFIRFGEITGSSTQVVREILRRIGQPDNIQMLPWARSYKLLQTLPNVALFSTTRTPEREDQFFWIGPLFTVHYGFYAKQGSGIVLNSLEDAKRVRSIATYKDDVKEQLLKSLGFTNLDSSNSPVSNLKKLLSGRVDLWLFDNLGMSDVARQLDVDPAGLELVLPFKSYQAYVAISRQTSHELVGRWQAALQGMVQDGTFLDISRRWLPEESIPDFKSTTEYAAGASVVTLYTENSPPTSFMRDGKPAGFAVDIVRDILRRIKQPDTISVVPWSRGYTLAQKAPNVALFSTTRLKQREKLFQWVGPLYTQTWAFYGRKGSGIRIRSLKAAKTIGRIGVYLKDAKAQYLESKGFQNLVIANRNISNIRHLMRGKIDLWVSSDFNMPYQVQQAGFDPSELELVYAFRKVSNYIAFSLDTPQAVIQEWQQGLEALKKDGNYMQIADKYSIQTHP